MTGDSITDFGRKHPVGEGDGLGSGYVNFVNVLLNTKFPMNKIRVLNTGVGGDTVRKLKARWQTDVLDLSPDYLSIKIGANDAWSKDENNKKIVSIEEFEIIYRELIRQAKEKIKNLKKIILITSFLSEADKNDPMMIELLPYIEVTKKIAADTNIMLVDTQPEFDRYFAYGIEPALLAPDRVHPSQVGSMIIAKAFLKVCGVDV